VLLLFVLLTVCAAAKFHNEPLRAT
jgi:hypothetical protein